MPKERDTLSTTDRPGGNRTMSPQSSRVHGDDPVCDRGALRMAMKAGYWMPVAGLAMATALIAVACGIGGVNQEIKGDSGEIGYIRIEIGQSSLGGSQNDAEGVVLHLRAMVRGIFASTHSFSQDVAKITSHAVMLRSLHDMGDEEIGRCFYPVANRIGKRCFA